MLAVAAVNGISSFAAQDVGGIVETEQFSPDKKLVRQTSQRYTRRRFGAGNRSGNQMSSDQVRGQPLPAGQEMGELDQEMQ